MDQVIGALASSAMGLVPSVKKRKKIKNPSRDLLQNRYPPLQLQKQTKQKILIQQLCPYSKIYNHATQSWSI
jgi:hypothetical protein